MPILKTMELIEREDFLDLLHNEFKKTATDEGHCFFITGEPGIGKTSLVKVFLSQVANQSIQYVGACDSLFTPRPLAPLYDLALQIKEDWPLKLQSTLSRTELFTKFAEELSNKSRPVILVFEDIHWADEATLDFVKYFARRIARMQCFFILTFRDEEVAQQHSLRNVLGDLPRDTFTRIRLTPLSRQAVHKLAVQKGFDAENVFNISGGNPFYVNEILASYSPGVPENIKDAILSVYDRQEEGTKNAWQICSVIPEGLEINRFVKIKASWDAAIDHCFAINILTVKNDKIVFKHELYRRTIENSLSPFKRIAMNKKMLELFLDSFEKEGEVERILHYARNANENALIVKYAPQAALQAASIGAHSEASKLYLMAIEYSDGHDLDRLVEFYEAYAYECYLTNQIKDAIIYQGKALKIWQGKNEVEETGNSLRLLSRFWWFEGSRTKAENYARQAIELLDPLPSSKAKAMALSNMSQLKMLAEESVSSIEWGNRAIEMAKEIKDDEILCHALNNVGASQWFSKPFEDNSNELLMESLQIALNKSYHEHAARAYANIVSYNLEFKKYDAARHYLQEGLNYCEERGLESWSKYLLTREARMLLETCDWIQSAAVAENLITNKGQPVIVRLSALVSLTRIEIRKGEAAAWTHLQEIRSLGFSIKEHQQIIPAMIAFLEYEWLTGKTIITEEELNIGCELTNKIDNIFLNSEFYYWLQKSREQGDYPANLYEPYKLLKAGKIAKAAEFWDEKACLFEKALALSEGTEDDQRNALAILQQAGAEVVCEKIKMEMRSSGIRKIPRGLRESTKANPAQLTNRELDILQMLQKAAQNKEIAEALFISPKTVGHHISSILFKLDVNSRAKAVAEAIRLGVLK